MVLLDENALMQWAGEALAGDVISDAQQVMGVTGVMGEVKDATQEVMDDAQKVMMSTGTDEEAQGLDGKDDSVEMDAPGSFFFAKSSDDGSETNGGEKGVQEKEMGGDIEGQTEVGMNKDEGGKDNENGELKSTDELEGNVNQVSSELNPNDLPENSQGQEEKVEGIGEREEGEGVEKAGEDPLAPSLEEGKMVEDPSAHSKEEGGIVEASQEEGISMVGLGFLNPED